jgi:hypothetical protein
VHAIEGKEGGTGRQARIFVPAGRDTKRRITMKHPLAAVMMCAAVTAPTAGSALADNVHTVIGMNGQPDSGGSIVNCGSNGLVSTPGNSGNAGAVNSKGSPFEPTAFAGSRYAASQSQNSNNPNSIAQYDVACFQATMHQNP